MMSHAFFKWRLNRRNSGLPVSTLAISMVEASLRALLVSAAGNTQLLKARATTTIIAAITLSEVAMSANEK